METDDMGHGILSTQNLKLLPCCDKCLECDGDYMGSSGVAVQLNLNLLKPSGNFTYHQV
jgi:hypothetical protein